MRLSIFCKSFRADLDRFSQLLASYEKYCEDELPFCLSVPREDRPLFLDKLGHHRVQLFVDEDILGTNVPQSWITQQLVKLEVYKTQFADVWFWLDSDSYFIRPFGRRDFIGEDGAVVLPVSRVLHMLDSEWDKIMAYVEDASALPPLAATELRTGAAAPVRRRISGLQRLLDLVRRPSFESRLPRIPEFFGRSGPNLNFLPGAVWTNESLRTFQTEVLDPLRITFADLLRYSPWEGTWIGEWELARGLPGRRLANSLLLHVGTDETIRRARSEAITEARLSARYLGLQLAARHQAYARLDER